MKHTFGQVNTKPSSGGWYGKGWRKSKIVSGLFLELISSYHIFRHCGCKLEKHRILFIYLSSTGMLLSVVNVCGSSVSLPNPTTGIEYC